MLEVTGPLGKGIVHNLEDAVRFLPIKPRGKMHVRSELAAEMGQRRLQDQWLHLRRAESCGMHTLYGEAKAKRKRLHDPPSPTLAPKKLGQLCLSCRRRPGQATCNLGLTPPVAAPLAHSLVEALRARRNFWPLQMTARAQRKVATPRRRTLISKMA